MRILFVISSLYGGGAERVVARLSSALCDRHEVHIATTSATEPGRSYQVDPRVTVHDLAATCGRNRLAARLPVIRSLNRWRCLRALKRRIGVDVSASFLTFCNHDNVMASVGERTVISIRSMLADTYTEAFRDKTVNVSRIKGAGKRADAVVCVSRLCADEQVELFGVDPAKLRVVYNPVDPAKLNALAQEPAAIPGFDAFRASHDVLIATSGRLTQQKGQWHLIRALRTVRQEHPGAGLVVLGTGELEQQLRRVAQVCSVTDHVLFCGFADNPFAVIKRCDLFCMPSLFEGFSNALLEAMALGVPLVAADCPSGPRELLAPGTDPHASASGVEQTEYGLLTPRLSGDESLVDEPLEPAEEDLARALVLLASDRDLCTRLATAGLKRTADFSIEAIASQWESVLLEGVDPR